MKRTRRIRAVLATAALCLATTATAQAATWQSQLEGTFLRAETFDELQDWTANGLSPSGSGDSAGYNSAYLPKKADGSPSMWTYWNNKGPTCAVTPVAGTFTSGETVRSNTGATYTFQKYWKVDGKTYLQFATGSSGTFRPGDTLTGMSSSATAKMLEWPKMIGDHGTAYNWGGSGKSLMMNLGDNDNDANSMKGIGAQRLGVFFGDGISGKSGLKKAYLFMMMKFMPGYFPKTDATNFAYVSVLKQWDLLPGFTAINYFGTPAEHATVSPDPQNLTEYGATGGSLIQLAGGGSSSGPRLYFNNLASNCAYSNGYWGYVNGAVTRLSDSAGNNDIQNYYNGNQWFGIEYALDMGTLGKNDGSAELWVYDQNGVQKGYFVITGQANLTHFDHWINKMTLGGNRRSGSTLTSSTDGRYFVDDVIIDGNRIGPKYFQLLSARGDATAPTTSIASPAAGTTVKGTAAVTVNATDNVGVSKVELYVDGALAGTDTASPYTFNWNTATATNGSHALTAKAYDAAGNVGQAASVSVTVSNITDTTAPSVSIASPATGSTVSGTSTVSVNATDNVGVAKVELYVNGTIYGVYGTAPYTVSWNTTSYANGTYTLTAKAYDAAGNVATSGSTSVTVKNGTTTADTTAPSVTSFTMPTTATSLTVPVSGFTASDNTGVAGYLITESATAPAAGATGWRTTAPTSFTFSAAGTRTAYAWAKDAAGNVSAGRSATVAVTVASPTATNLVAAYSFDEGTGTVVTDKSGNGNNGTIGYATWTTAGKYGSALSFNGTSAKVTVPDSASLHLTTGMTLEAWVRPTRVTSVWQDVIYKGNDVMYLEATTPTSARPVGGAATTGTTAARAYGASALTANTWTHLAVTYDAAYVRLYVNGVLAASTARTGTIASSTYPLQIGGDSIYGEYFAGTIDEVRVYKAALTQAQIQADMQAAIGR